MKSYVKLLESGNVERIVYLNDHILNILKSYLETRNDDIEALFISKNKKRINRRTVENICKTAYELIGIFDTSKYCVHTLRHTAAVLIYRTTKDILVVQKILGHKRISTTMIYTHIENDMIKQAVEANPLAKFKC